MTTTSHPMSLPPPFSTVISPWHPLDARQSSEFNMSRGANGGSRDGHRFPYPRSTRSSSQSQHRVDLQSTREHKRPRRPTQRYEPTTRRPPSATPSYHAYESTRPRRATSSQTSVVDIDDPPRKKKRVVREGICSNCGCNQSETTLWRTNPLERSSSNNKYKPENLLCNACGIWTVTHGTPRPRRYWDQKRRGAASVEPLGADNLQRMSEEVEPCLDQIEEDQGLDLLEAAEALLGLKNQSRSPPLASLVKTEPLAVTASHSIILTSPAAPLFPRHLPQLVPTRFRSSSLRDQHAQVRSKPKKRRRAPSPSMYVRSPSVGCTSVPPSVQREQRRPALTTRASDPGSSPGGQPNTQLISVRLNLPRPV